MLKKLNITPGLAMDITACDSDRNPWDLDNKE